MELWNFFGILEMSFPKFEGYKNANRTEMLKQHRWLKCVVHTCCFSFFYFNSSEILQNLISIWLFALAFRFILHPFPILSEANLQFWLGLANGRSWQMTTSGFRQWFSLLCYFRSIFCSPSSGEAASDPVLGPTGHPGFWAPVFCQHWGQQKLPGAANLCVASVFI